MGTTLAIIGPNGAGKSILLRALIGAVPSRGTVRWAPGTTVGYVPQKLDLERDLPLTGFDLLYAKAEICGSPRAEPGVGAVYALLRRLQLERSLTVLLISHELTVVFEQADNVLCLAHGVTFFGKPIEVLTPEYLQQVYGGRVRFHRHVDAAL